ncbi:hypothetical protein BJV82DRAFT_664247 [Fennellomyces sp. T-0311]|nr:hypothetical protein BJV82DRAFT_664247 [Fennellomyces sp. T-0311]
MSDSSKSPWIATDDHDDVSPQDERRRHTPTQSSDFNPIFPLEVSATSDTTPSASSGGRHLAAVSYTPSPTGISLSYGTPSLPPGSTAHQWSLDPQHYPESPLPGADSSSSEHELPLRASPKRRLSYDEVLTREQRGDLMALSLRSRRSSRTIRSASRSSSFTPDRPVNMHPSTSLGVGRSLTAAPSTYVSAPDTQQRHSLPIISPPPDFATSVSLQQQRIAVEADAAIPPRMAAPLVPEARAVNDFEEELRFLRDQWTSVCITLSSLRNMYVAVASSSTGTTVQESSVAGSSSESSSTQQDLAEFPVPSSISVTSFIGTAPPPNQATRSLQTQQRRGRRSNRRARGRTTNEQTQGERHRDGIHPDVQQEMLIGYDDAMLQIRQLEYKVETLEAEIRRLMEASDPSRPS